MSVSTEVTFPQQWNVAIVCPKAKRKGELCLNPICSASSHFHIRRGLKDRWSQYRFPHSIFPQTLSASSLSAAVLSFFFTIFLFSSLVLHLHSTRLVFFGPSLYFALAHCLYLSVSACTTTLCQAPYQYRREGEKALSDPLCFHFPKFLRGTDSIGACWWGWQWHLKKVKVPLPLDACLLRSSRTPIPLTSAKLKATASSTSWKRTFLVWLEMVITCATMYWVLQ